MKNRKLLVASFFVASLLALVAVGIRWQKRGTVNWPVAAAAVFLAAAGVQQARSGRNPSARAE